MKLVILDAYTTNPGDLSWQPLEAFGELTVYDRTSPEQVLQRAADADMVLTNKVVLGASHFAQLPKLKFVELLSTGTNAVDLDAARSHNITVSNVPGYSTDSVAQHVFALILHTASRVALHDESVHRGDWQSCEDFMYTKAPMFELAGQTLGIFGFGSIGQRVGEIGHAFGMNILAHKRTPDDKPGYEPFAYVEPERLFAESDIVTLHAPQTPETTGLVDAAVLASMKPSALLVNTARGGLIVEQDLADALNHDVIAGAAVDVVSVEPIEAENPLLKAKRCVITPHNAWAYQQARQRLIDIVVENVKGFIRDKPVNVVT